MSSEHPPADFARTCLSRDGSITLSVIADGKTPKWELAEDRFWILAESIAETAKKLVQNRRIYVATGDREVTR